MLQQPQRQKPCLRQMCCRISGCVQGTSAWSDTPGFHAHSCRMRTSRRNWNSFIPMSEYSFLSLCVAAGLAVAWSIIFTRKIARQKKITRSDVKTWIKNVFDSLFGMG